MGESGTGMYHFITHLMLVGATLFWGLNPMLMKLGLQELSPLHFNLFRLIVALIFTMMIMVMSRSFVPLRRRDLPHILCLSLFGFFVFQMSYTYGVDYTSASVAAILLGLLPISVVLHNRIIGNRDITLLKAIGIGATLIGVICIAAGRYDGISLENTYVSGVLLFCIAELAYGGYTVFVKPLTARYPISEIIAVVIAVSILLFFLFSIPTLEELELSSLSASTYLSVTISGITALSAGNILWSSGIKRIGSVNTSVYGNLPPVFGVAAGVILLSESLTLLQILGAIAIVTGVFLVNSRSARKIHGGKKSRGRNGS